MSSADALEAALGVQWEPLLVAAGLLVAAAALLLLEFFVVSFGLLLTGALALVAGAVYFAFEAGTAAGWVFVVLTPLVGYRVARFGVTRVQRSKLVPKSAIAGEAGYHHLADRLGIGPGSRGEMVTAARPSGRARFAGGECDVQVVGGSLERGAPVQVQRIGGPVVYVVPIEPEEAEGEE